MKYWRTLSCVMVAVVVATGCGGSAGVNETEQSADVRPQVEAIEPTAVTLEAAEPDPTATPYEIDPDSVRQPGPTTTPATTVAPASTATPAPTSAPVASTDHSGLAGSRGLTLQWISWEPDEWGSVEFVPLTDGSYRVTGRQDGPDGDYVSIDGTIVKLTDLELRFTGDVTSLVSYTNNGQPCIRSGDLTFLATQGRQFWRMQDLLNCDGSVTDYVDIYFG